LREIEFWGGRSWGRWEVGGGRGAGHFVKGMFVGDHDILCNKEHAVL